MQKVVLNTNNLAKQDCVVYKLTNMINIDIVWLLCFKFKYCDVLTIRLVNDSAVVIH